MDPEESGQQTSQGVTDAGNTVKNTAQNIGNKTKQAVNKAKDKVKKAREAKKKADKAKAADKAAKGFGSVLKAIAPALPYILIALAILAAIVLIIIAVIAIIGAVKALLGGTYENGEFIPNLGVKGDAFWGERFMYYDTAFSSEEIGDVYKELTYNVLVVLKGSGKLSATATLGEDYKSDLISINIATNLAKSISTYNDEGKQLTYYTRAIDHYGLTSEEQESFITIMSNYLKDNNLKQNQDEDLTLIIKSKLDGDLKYIKNVCGNIIIKDYLFAGDDDGLSKITQKNYLGMVFMPKKDVKIEETDIAFVVGDGVNVTASLNYVQGENVTNIANAEVDSSWFKDGCCEEFMEAELKDYQLKEFTAFDQDKNYLTEGKSLFTLLRENKFIIYFNETNDFSAENLLKNIKTENYIYVGCESEKVFIVADARTEY